PRRRRARGRRLDRRAGRRRPGGRARLPARRRPPRHACPLLPEHAAPRPSPRRVGRRAVRRALPPPLWNPVLVAEQVGTLATLAPGRFILRLAAGGKDQSGPMGVRVHHRGRHFEAGLDVVRRLLAGETVTTQEPPHVRNARVSPVPPEPVEVWIGGTHEAAVDRAARLGDGFLANADVTPEQARALIELYRERCDAHGRTPTAVAIRRDIHVGADPADAERVAGPVVAAGYRGFDPSACTYGGGDPGSERRRRDPHKAYTHGSRTHPTQDK